MAGYLTQRFDTRGMLRVVYGQQQKFRKQATAIIKAENEKAAAFIANAMAEVVEEKAGHIGSRERAQRSDHRLPTSLRDARNWTASSAGFGVGIASWLNQSPAKMYWRRIDEGHAPQEMLAARFFAGAGTGNSGSADRLIQGLKKGGATFMTSRFPAFDFTDDRHLRSRLDDYDIGPRYVEALSKAGISATLR